MNTYDRRHIDNATRTLLHHDRGTSVDKVESGLQVHVQHSVPLSLAHTHHQAVFRDTGVVHQDIDTSEILHDLGNDVMSLLKVSSVGSVSFRLYTQGLDLSLCSQAILIDH